MKNELNPFANAKVILNTIKENIHLLLFISVYMGQ